MDDSRQDVLKTAGAALTREQKAGFIFVVVIGLSALLLGGQYLWTHIAGPFVINYTGPRFVTGAEADLAAKAEQKKLDTDGDGINDYDELYIYKTSPYLADSDSDGLQDGVEINSGQDPNCAKGAECSLAVNEDISLSTKDPELEAEGASLAERQQALDAVLNELRDLPAADVRQLLLESGADPATVAGLSDTEVTDVYRQILTELEGSGELDAIFESTPVTPSP